MKKCRYCAEEIQDEALVCRFCGRDQSGAPQSTTPPKVQKVRQADWISTTAKWGCGTLLLLAIFGFVFGFCG